MAPKSTTMNIPANLVDQVQKLLALGMAQLNVDSDDEQDDESSTYEAEKILGHRIEKDGTWSFDVLFYGAKDDEEKREWIPDALCDCPHLIKEYIQRKKLKVTNAYLFCRVSTKEQSSCTSTSLESQESELVKASTPAPGVVVRRRIYKISESAYHNIPKTLLEIGQVAMSGDTIYVWRIDRLSRNIITYLAWLENLHNSGVKIVGVSEDLSYADNKLDFIQAILNAQKEAHLLGERVKLSNKHKRDRGDEAVGSLPYGKIYKRVMNLDKLTTKMKLVVDSPEEVLLLLRIKKSKMKPLRMALTLNKEGKYKRNHKWTEGMIKRVRSMD